MQSHLHEQLPGQLFNNGLRIRIYGKRKESVKQMGNGRQKIAEVVNAVKSPKPGPGAKHFIQTQASKAFLCSRRPSSTHPYPRTLCSASKHIKKWATFGSYLTPISRCPQSTECAHLARTNTRGLPPHKHWHIHISMAPAHTHVQSPPQSVKEPQKVWSLSKVLWWNWVSRHMKTWGRR